MHLRYPSIDDESLIEFRALEAMWDSRDRELRKCAFLVALRSAGWWVRKCLLAIRYVLDYIKIGRRAPHIGCNVDPYTWGDVKFLLWLISSYGS